MKYLKIKDEVEFLLRNYPHLRDNDNKLIANIWHKESKGVTTKDVFLRLLSENQLTSPESIRRSRQKIQEHNIDLRGVKYKVRQGKLEPTVKAEIREWGQGEQTNMFNK